MRPREEIIGRNLFLATYRTKVFAGQMGEDWTPEMKAAIGWMHRKYNDIRKATRREIQWIGKIRIQFHPGGRISIWCPAEKIVRRHARTRTFFIGWDSGSATQFEERLDQFTVREIDKDSVKRTAILTDIASGRRRPIGAYSRS